MTTESSPRAVKQLRENNERLSEEIAFLKHQIKELTANNNYLEELVRHFRRKQFARSSEVAPSGQGTLFNEAELVADEAESQETKPTCKPRKRGKPKRAPLPDKLPRVEKSIDLPENEKFCAKSGRPLRRIGEEVSEQLDIEPMKVKVIVTKRAKYICDCSECTSQADGPAAEISAANSQAGSVEKKTSSKVAPMELQPIPKSMAAAGLLAYIVVSKYADALPLARQEQMFKRFGIHINRATMASWVMALGKLVIPLINLIRDELVLGPVIQADETRIQVHKGTGKKATAKSYMWAFMRDGPRSSKIILYELGPTRSHEVPLRVLEDYQGFLHTDGYEAYETLATKVPGITLVGDWAHVRRKFDEAIKALPKNYKGEVKAKVAMELIDELFRIERKDMTLETTNEERLKIRQEKSQPLIDKLKAWADATAPTLPPKSLSGTAVRYMLERWTKLILFLKHPILRLDTNPIEGGVIRPFVTGRKNWLFADTMRGAEASAALYSLVVMARFADLNPFDYLKAVFTELPKAQTADEVATLLPWNWKPAPVDSQNN